MDPLKVISFSADALHGLRRDFSKLEETTPFSKVPKLAAKIASLGIHREIGTVNDELARFIFDKETGEVVARESLKSSLVEWRGFVGVRIWSEQTARLELRARWFQDVLHPDFSCNVDGSVGQLVVFPEIVSRITALEGVELVLVKSWGMNSIFGGFDPSKGYYQTNFWELENNDALMFSNLVRGRRLALLGTHDLIAHVAGVRSEKWELLQKQAAQVHDGITEYFEGAKAPTIASLILPYTIGVVLDDLAQPPTYASSSHAAFLAVLLRELAKKSVPPHLPTVLREFPSQFEKIIALSRQPDVADRPDEITALVAGMTEEILRHSLIRAV